MFYKKVNKNSYKEMFNFVSSHFQYYTLNSWNGLKSIANNVKLYNLPLKHDWQDVLAALDEDNWTQVNLELESFQEMWPTVEVNFNGRHGGYLVLYNKNSSYGPFENEYDSPTHFHPDEYEIWKRCVREDYGTLKNYKCRLVEEVEIIQDFDKLCDDLVELVDFITEEYLKSNSTPHPLVEAI